MIDLKKQNEIFELIGKKLKKKIECYVIGGSAMLYYGMKSETKDVDLVFEHENDREEIISTLENLGYNKRESKILYFNKKNTPVLLEREDARFDLFLNKIISTVLSDSMKKRVELIYEYGNFIVKSLAAEDLIITKCATERAGDRKDVHEIIKATKVDWEIIIKESVYQASVTPYIFPVFLFDFLYELKEDLKADIPNDVINKIRKIAEEEMVKAVKKKKKS